MGSKVATVVFAAIVGSVILFLGVPRTIAAFVVLPGQQVLQSVQSGETVDRQKLESFVALQRRALAWVHSGRVWRDLAVGQRNKRFGDSGYYYGRYRTYYTD